MSEGYRFLEDVAIADVDFQAWGPDLAAVFRQAALATAETMVDDLTTVRAREQREVTLRANSAERALFDFLQELIYYKDTEGLILRPEAVRVTEEATGEGFGVTAILAGETIDPERHPLNADVKAVTMHRFRLETTPQGWEAEAVLDV